MLHEQEIFSCMAENLAGAIEDCEAIARQRESGARFDSLRKRLKLVEGCCTQAAYWRQDARWLPLGVMMEQVHQRAREWLHYPSVQSKKLFVMLADNLRKLEREVRRLRFMATGKTGVMLPKPRPSGRLSSTVLISGYRPSSGGVLLPNG